jgi:pimeloyl-ACP methyl ester carboxylesterase
MLGGAALSQTADLPRALFADPPRDAAHPARMEAVRIASHGQMMNVVIYHAAGAGPHPAALLIHGLPGNEQNLDLAQVLRRAGWTVFTYHYRGSWGSEGTFSVPGVEEDADAMLAAMRKDAAHWNIDPKRMVVVGHSLGGFAAAHAGAANPDVLASVLLAPWDPAVDAAFFGGLTGKARADMAEQAFDDMPGRLVGKTPLELADDIAAHGAAWGLAGNAQSLAGRPLLVVTARRDSPSCKVPNLRPALDKAAAKSVVYVEYDADHAFNETRMALEAQVLSFLSHVPGAPPLN